MEYSAQFPAKLLVTDRVTSVGIRCNCFSKRLSPPRSWLDGTCKKSSLTFCRKSSGFFRVTGLSPTGNRKLTHLSRRRLKKFFEKNRNLVLYLFLYKNDILISQIFGEILVKLARKNCHSMKFLRILPADVKLMYASFAL